MLVKIRNPVSGLQEISALSQKVDAGGTSLPVLNTEGFSSNQYIVIGKMGEEQTELRQISQVVSTGITLSSSVSFSHPTNTPVYVISYNQVEISRKTTPSGSYSVLTTRDLEVDEPETVYDDTNGQLGYTYRARFYNSYAGQYSDYSGEILGSGFSTKAAKPMIDIILRRTNDKNADFTSRQEVLEDLNIAQGIIGNRLIAASSEFYRVNYLILAERYKHEYTLPTNFKEISKVYTADGDGPRNEILPVIESHTGYELRGERTLYLVDVPSPTESSTVTPIVVLGNDAYDADGTWTASLDAENVTTDTDEFKQGTGSINFDVDVSDDAGNTAALTNSTFTAQDLSDYEDAGKFRIPVSIPDATYITSFDFRWGSSASDYWSLNITSDYKRRDFVDGWNVLEFDWADSDVAETGTPVASAVDYMQIRMNYSAAQPDDTDFRLDAILLSNVWSANTLFEVVYFREPLKLTTEMSELDIPVGYQNLMLDYVIGHIKLRKAGQETIGVKHLTDFDEHSNEFIAQAAKRTRRPRGMRVFGRERRY